MTERDKDIGANDVKVLDVLGNVAERAAAAVSHKLLHPMIEQYAQLFRNGARTPVLRRPPATTS